MAYTINLDRKELTEIIRALETRGDLRTNYGEHESKTGQLCYDLAEKLREIRSEEV